MLTKSRANVRYTFTRFKFFLISMINLNIFRDKLHPKVHEKRHLIHGALARYSYFVPGVVVSREGIRQLLISAIKRFLHKIQMNL